MPNKVPNAVSGKPVSFWQPLVSVTIWLLIVGCVVSGIFYHMLTWLFPIVFDDTLIKIMGISVSVFLGALVGIATLPFILRLILGLGNCVDFLKCGKGCHSGPDQVSGPLTINLCTPTKNRTWTANFGGSRSIH